MCVVERNGPSKEERTKINTDGSNEMCFDRVGTHLEDGVEAESVRFVAHGLSEVVLDVEHGLACGEEGVLVHLREIMARASRGRKDTRKRISNDTNAVSM